VGDLEYLSIVLVFVRLAIPGADRLSYILTMQFHAIFTT